jgi:hypothetical protein
LQREHALVHRQGRIRVAFQPAIPTRLGRAGQPFVATRIDGFAGPQFFRQHLGLCPRHGQFLRQGQRAVRIGIAPRHDCVAALRECGLADAGQALAGIHAIRIQRQCRLVEFARALSVRRGQSPFGQCAGGVGAQLLGARVRPQPVGQRLPYQQQQHDRHHGHDEPARGRE